MINDNGFRDPYNSYIKIRVQSEVPLTGDEYIQRLDQSGHSLISTLIVRVAGQEIERIEHYDLLAALLNDLSYSSEQRLAHAHEGFGNITRKFPEGEYKYPAITATASGFTGDTLPNPATSAHNHTAGSIDITLSGGGAGAHGTRLGGWSTSEATGANLINSLDPILG